MKYLYLFLCVLISFTAYSQNKQSEIDSLYVALNKSKTDTTKINIYFKISQKYLNIDDLNKADSLSIIFFKLSKKNNFIKGYGCYYYNLATILTKQNKKKQAISEFNKSNYYFYKLKNKSNYFESIYYTAFCYMEINQSQKGKDLVIKALNTIKKPSYTRELSYLNFFMGVYYSEGDRDLNKSLDFFLKSNYYATKVNYTEVILNCYSEIILIYFKSENWKKALYYATLSENYLKSTFKITTNLNMLYEATFLSYLSKSNFFLNNQMVSLLQSKKAIELGQKIKYESLIYLNKNLISANYYSLGNYALSIKNSRYILSEFPKNNNWETNHIIGKCYLKLLNYPKAIHFLKIALKEYSNSIENENYFGKYELYKDLADVSEALKDYKSAYFYNKLYSNKKITILEQKNKSKIIELTERFHSKNLEMDNYRLLEIKKKKNLELNFQKREIQMSYLILGLFLMLGIILIIYNVKNKRTNLLLNSQKKQLEGSEFSIKKSLKQKELLLKEIHHRVKNNLQLIISLQNIQARRNINGSISDFLEKEQNRITAMALIHQSLYLNDDLEDVIFSDYINNLISYIQNSELRNNINFELSFKNLNFDLETSLPLGLILNELITNSYKHAFPNETKGTIYIRIDTLLENNYMLIYSDTGIPFPNEKVNTKSFGLELVALLAKQMRGKLLPLDTEKKELKMIFKTINTDS